MIDNGKFQHLGSTFPIMFLRKLARLDCKVVAHQNGNWKKSNIYVADNFRLHFRHYP